jgi:hypothetical protein
MVFGLVPTGLVNLAMTHDVELTHLDAVTHDAELLDCHIC